MFPLYLAKRITRITAYQVNLPLHEGSYKWAGGKSVEYFDSTIVRLETNDGFVGFGENTPLGPAYLPAFAQGTRAGIAVLADSLIGVDPTQLHDVNTVMDRGLNLFILYFSKTFLI
jgi:cis-L-3-hydroxyproline dehydratase